MLGFRVPGVWGGFCRAAFVSEQCCHLGYAGKLKHSLRPLAQARFRVQDLGLGLGFRVRVKG